MLDITLDSAIRFKFNPTEYIQLAEAIKLDTTVDNPEYVKRKRLGKSLYGIDPYLKYRDHDYLVNTTTLPRGYWAKLRGHLNRLGIEYMVEDRRYVGPPLSFPSATLTLRDYQVPAVEAMTHEEDGVLVGGCGTGKTACGMEIIRRIGRRTLWVTHTKDLAEQTAEAAIKMLGLVPDEIGMIGDGYNCLGSRLTIALVQSLGPLTADLAHEFGLVILDEAHHVPAETFAIVNQFRALCRYGLTATPERADGLGPVINLYLGPIRYEIQREATNTLIPELKKVSLHGKNAAWAAYTQERERWEASGRKYREPRMAYGAMLAELLADMERNTILVENIVRTAADHCSLVLSERVDHCLALRSALLERFPAIRAEVLHGKQSKDARSKIIQDCRDGRLDVLLAVDIAKEGLDIPRLDRLHLVAGGRNEAELEQKVGRIMRPAEGKTDAIVFDYVDEDIGVLLHQYYGRRRVYKRLGIIPGTTATERKAG